jgi:hypothetical protein
MTSDHTPARRGLSAAELAALIDGDAAEGGCWCKHEIAAGPARQATTHPLAGLAEHLAQAFDSAAEARAWMHAPCAYLGGRAPVEALRSGAVDQVFNALAFAGARANR